MNQRLSVWCTNAGGWPLLEFSPIGWNGRLRPDHPLPVGVRLEADPELREEPTTLDRLVLGATDGWNLEQTVDIPPLSSGYLAYLDAKGAWRVRHRQLITMQPGQRGVRVHLKHQPTQLAFLDPDGYEIDIKAGQKSTAVPKGVSPDYDALYPLY